MLEYNKIKAPETEYIRFEYNKITETIDFTWSYGKVIQCSNGREIGIEANGDITDIATGAPISENNLTWFLLHDNFVHLEKVCNELKTSAKLA